MLGIFSLFLPLVTITQESTVAEEYLLQDVFISGMYIGPEFMVACSLFLGGLLLSFITPTAGFVQLVGALGILILYPAGFREFHGTPAPSWGAVAGIVSACLVVASLYFPLGPGYGSFKSRRYFGQANRFLTVTRLDSTAKFRVNMLCLAGALLALVAMGVPWFTHQTISAQPSVTQYDSHSLFMVFDQSFGPEAVLAAIVFICGTAVAFVTPLGGIGQVFGALWFWQTRHLIVGTLATSGWIDRNYFDSGFYLGIVASGMVLASMFVPLGIGYILRRKTLLSRLIIWGASAARL
jgi:hypothetical protein